MTRLRVSLETEDALTAVRVRGELDVATAPELKDRLAEALGLGKPLLVSLEDVTFMDSRGIGVLVGATRQAREVGSDVAILMTCAAHVQSVKILKLHNYLTLAESEADARASLAAAGKTDGDAGAQA